MNSNVFVSLITVTFNSERTLEDTIGSILSQNYNYIEYIIVDGLSTDKTVEIASRYIEAFRSRGYIFKIISEPDKGLYDAMNKGINLASGEIIGLINSDDIYFNDIVISTVVEKFIEEDNDLTYGNLQFVDQFNTDIIKRVWIAGYGKFAFGWNPPHPTTFVKKAIYDKYGMYNINLKISSDYDMLYRLFEKYKVKSGYINSYLVKMRYGGQSTKNFKSNYIGNKEIYSILKKNKQKGAFIILVMRNLRKLKQYRY